MCANMGEKEWENGHGIFAIGYGKGWDGQKSRKKE